MQKKFKIYAVTAIMCNGTANRNSSVLILENITNISSLPSLQAEYEQPVHFMHFTHISHRAELE